MSSPSNGGPSKETNARREAIIDIAARSFARKGFHGVSMRDIAKANHSSVATLYNHFSSKDAMMLAIGERFYVPYLRDVKEAAAADTDNLSRLLSMLSVAYEHGFRHRSEFLSLSHDVRHVRQTDALAPMVAWRNEAVMAWYQVIEAGMADGTVKSGLEPGALIWIIFYAITGILEDTTAQEVTVLFANDPLSSLRVLLSEGLRPRTD